MIQALVALGIGLLFGAGLLLSGMTDPARVLGFLDIAGHWNPALGFVMAGAIAVAAPAFAWARAHRISLLGDPINLPDRYRIDSPLVVGAALFGVGWGIGGICPGPGIVLLGQDLTDAATFVVALILGNLIADFVRKPILSRPRDA